MIDQKIKSTKNSKKIFTPFHAKISESFNVKLNMIIFARGDWVKFTVT